MDRAFNGGPDLEVLVKAFNADITRRDLRVGFAGATLGRTCILRTVSNSERTMQVPYFFNGSRWEESVPTEILDCSEIETETCSSTSGTTFD